MRNDELHIFFALLYVPTFSSDAPKVQELSRRRKLRNAVTVLVYNGTTNHEAPSDAGHSMFQIRAEDMV